MPTEQDIEIATALYEDAPQGCAWCAALCPDHAGDFIDAIAAALTKQREETWKEDDADFIKLVRQLAAINPAADRGFVDAIIEDVRYNAHRVDRLYAAEAARNEGNSKQ